MNNYGYYRAEVLGAITSILIIWVLLGWLLSEAVARLISPPEVNGEIMLITAIIGLGCNLLNLCVLESCCNDREQEGDEVDQRQTLLLSSFRNRGFFSRSFRNGTNRSQRPQRRKKILDNEDLSHSLIEDKIGGAHSVNRSRDIDVLSINSSQNQATLEVRNPHQAAPE